MIVPVLLLQWVANAVVVLYFPTAFDVYSGKSVTFGFLALMALTQAHFTWRFIPKQKINPSKRSSATGSGRNPDPHDPPE